MNHTYFTEIYKKYYTRILSYVKVKIGNEEEALQLTHDIFLKCYEALDSYNPELSSMSTWLYVIAKNSLKNYYRGNKWKQVELDEGELAQICGKDCVEEAVLLEEARIILLENMKKLSPREQKVLVLKYYYGEDSAKIGDILGLQPGNVRVILKRSLDKLKKLMK